MTTANEQIIYTGAEGDKKVEAVFFPNEKAVFACALRVDGKVIASGASLSQWPMMTRCNFVPLSEQPAIEKAFAAAQKAAREAGTIQPMGSQGRADRTASPAARVNQGRVNPATTWVGQASMEPTDSIF